MSKAMKTMGVAAAVLLVPVVLMAADADASPSPECAPRGLP